MSHYPLTLFNHHSLLLSYFTITFSSSLLLYQFCLNSRAILITLAHIFMDEWSIKLVIITSYKGPKNLHKKDNGNP